MQSCITNRKNHCHYIYIYISLMLVGNMAPLSWYDLDAMEESVHQDNTDIKL